MTPQKYEEGDREHTAHFRQPGLFWSLQRCTIKCSSTHCYRVVAGGVEGTALPVAGFKRIRRPGRATTRLGLLGGARDCANSKKLQLQALTGPALRRLYLAERNASYGGFNDIPCFQVSVTPFYQVGNIQPVVSEGVGRPQVTLRCSA